MKRTLDILLSATALICLSPLLAAAAIAVRISSPGPVLYRAARVGRDGREFTMLKFRTMHVRREDEEWTAITAGQDSRVFRAGYLLRKFKIDELPQLLNILRGDMSVIGPRPEDSGIVDRFYSEMERRTLSVRPGLASRGSLYYYTHLESQIPANDAEGFYAREILPVKARLDLIDIEHPSLFADVRIIFATLKTLVQLAAGRRDFPEPVELRTAGSSIHESAASTISSQQRPTDSECIPSASRRRAA